MKGDEIETVFLEAFKKKVMHLSKKTLIILYRTRTGNFSPTSLREFIITCKALEILKQTSDKMFDFSLENFSEYLKIKDDLK